MKHKNRFGQHGCWAVWLLAAPLLLACATSWADGNELFAATEVTKRIDIAWDKMARLEPAAGQAAAAGEGGEAEAKPTKKKLQGPPPLPVVRIGGAVVETNLQRLAEEAKATLPPALQGPQWQDNLQRRFNISTYAHNPSQGNKDAPITVIIFADLACGDCMPQLAKIDAGLRDFTSQTQVFAVHAPSKQQDTNVAAFYGKVAARLGHFWEFRARLIDNKPTDSNAIFNELIASGLSQPEIRVLMLSEARRFYRELDADALLAKSFGVSTPPVVFVNGIRVGENGVPLDLLPDVLAYVSARIAHQLPEPPL